MLNLQNDGDLNRFMELVLEIAKLVPAVKAKLKQEINKMTMEELIKDEPIFKKASPYFERLFEILLDKESLYYDESKFDSPLKSLAFEVGISLSALEKNVKSTFGTYTGFHMTLEWVVFRVLTAIGKKKLKDSFDSVKMIAISLGIAPVTFNKKFKQAYRQTPLQYRKCL